MTVRNLVNIINSFGVKVVYDSKKKVAERLDSPIYFTPVDSEERKKYEKCRDKSKFRTSTAAIHIPDLTLIELVDIFKCDGIGAYEDTKTKIASFVTNDIPEEAIYVTYVFLHEVGHWKQFQNLGMNVEQYCEVDREAREEHFNKRNKVLLERQERLQKGNDCILTYREKIKLKNLFEEYRNIPQEKDADQFAFNNMHKILSKYKKHIGG